MLITWPAKINNSNNKAEIKPFNIKLYIQNWFNLAKHMPIELAINIFYNINTTTQTQYKYANIYI